MGPKNTPSVKKRTLCAQQFLRYKPKRGHGQTQIETQKHRQSHIKVCRNSPDGGVINVYRLKSVFSCLSTRCTPNRSVQKPHILHVSHICMWVDAVKSDFFCNFKIQRFSRKKSVLSNLNTYLSDRLSRSCVKSASHVFFDYIFFIVHLPLVITHFRSLFYSNIIYLISKKYFGKYSNGDQQGRHIQKVTKCGLNFWAETGCFTES